ncbi:MAG TPA: hypothetical protein VIH26_09985 [Anaerolineales bacterium]
MHPTIFVHPLPPNEVANLQKAYRSPRSAWSRTLIQVALLSHHGYPPPTISQIVHMSNDSMQRIIGGYEAKGLSGLVRRPGGRLIIEVFPLTPERIEVAVTRTCDNPVVIDAEEELMKEIVRLWPQAVIRREQPQVPTVSPSPPGGKRGGPAGTPENQRIKIVRGWLRVQGRTHQEVYASSQDISTSTLRRWMRQLREEGKL